MKPLEIYVKSNSNCEGLPLQSYEPLGAPWTGESILIPFGPERKPLEVVGICSLIGRPVCPIHAVKVRATAKQSATGEPVDGVLLYGGDFGVRVLDEDGDPLYEDYPETLKGYGLPFVWVDDPNDLPAEVRAVIE